MFYRFLFVALIVFAAGCVQPVVTDTPPAAVSPFPSSTATCVGVIARTSLCISPTPSPTLSNTSTVTPSNTVTETLTPSPTFTPSATATVTMASFPTLTATITPTADKIEFYFPQDIPITPWSTETAPYLIQCLLAYYDWYWFPGRIIVYRRDMAGYFACVAKETH